MMNQIQTDVATETDEDVAVAVNLSAEEYDGDSYSFGIISNPYLTVQ
jgi:hypothetical protein